MTGRGDDAKTIVYPELGSIHLQCQVLFTHDQGQALLVFTATPGSDDHTKLQMLSVIGTQQLTGEQPRSFDTVGPQTR